MDNIYQSTEEYNPNKKCKMIADMLSNRKPNPLIIELYVKGWKVSISFALLKILVLLYQRILD